MIEHDGSDGRDPIAAAFADYKRERGPRDVVPRHVEHSVGDLRRLADGGTQVQVRHVEVTKDGVTEHSAWVTVTHPITTAGEETL